MNNAKPHESDATTSEFAQVFHDELLAVQAWRDARSARNDKTAREQPQDLRAAASLLHAESDVERDEDKAERLQAAALQHNLCGLAISGGGIRSATFALGVLQGLAFTGLLRKFDYLSTVSGGGYIGSWLTAGIQRHGFAEMEQRLLPPKYRVKPPTAESADHPSIRHLRLYGNYLAPRPGIFTVEGWLLIAIYFRNMLLHQLVLLFAAIGMVLALRGVVEGLGNLKWNAALDSRGWPLFLISLSAIALVVGSLQMKRTITERLPLQRSLAGMPYYLVFFGMLAAILYLAGLVHLAARPMNGGTGTLVWLNALCFAALGLLQYIHDPNRASISQIRRLTSSLCAGLVAGLVAGLFFRWLANIPAVNGGGMIAIWSTLGVPVLISTGVLGNFLYVGFAGRHLESSEREFWSLFNARALMLAVIWMGLFGLVVYAPVALVTIFGEGREWLATALASGWVASLVSFLWAAQSEKSGDGTSKSFLDILARIAPFAFLATLFSAVALVTVWLAYDGFALWMGYTEGSPGYRRFADSMPELLKDLDRHKADSGRWSSFGSFVLYFLGAALAFGLARSMGRLVGVNRFSLQELYKNRLVRCYLGATNDKRKPNSETDFDFDDDLPMSSLLPSLDSHSSDESSNRWGPFPIINFALNQRSSKSDNSNLANELAQSSLAFVERKARPFFCSPYHTGSIRTGFCRTSSFANDIQVGTAVAVSGAAVSPNMGYHSSPLTTMLLTIFNLRLGAWFGNPSREATRYKEDPSASLKLMLDEMAGKTGADADYVYLSDGGHFENTGVYELLRRRCRFIVVVDAGSDPQIHENIGRVVRLARIDFGININVDMSPVTPSLEGQSLSHVTVGRIHYAHRHGPPTSDSQSGDNEADFADPSYRYEDNQGIIVWIKNTMTGTEPVDLKNFRAMNGLFPFDPTMNQFYGESRFESYRMLGFHSVFKILENVSFRQGTANDDQPLRPEFEVGGPLAASVSLSAPPASEAEAKRQHFDSNAAKQKTNIAYKSRTRFSAAFANYMKPAIRVVAHKAVRPSHSADETVPIDHQNRPLFFDDVPVRSIFEDIFNYWLAKPKQFGLDYVRQNEIYMNILEKLRTTPILFRFAAELYGTFHQKEAARQKIEGEQQDSAEMLAERLMIGEMMTLLENVWFALDLERNRLHPVHAGWMQVFHHWIHAPTVLRHWNHSPVESTTGGYLATDHADRSDGLKKESRVCG